MTTFKPPKGQRICLQYIRSKPYQPPDVLAVVTQTILPGSFSLFLPSPAGWKKQSTKLQPDFDAEVLPLYEIHKA